MKTLQILLFLPAVAIACKGEASSTAGLDEPIRVHSAQFISGAAPGSPPIDAGAAASPSVVDILAASRVITPGEAGKSLSGHATPDAQSIAVRFADLGTGYWVMPTGGPDPSDDNLLTWQLSADFARNLPSGFHSLIFSAVDANGGSGTETALDTCIDTPVPDNLNACDPKRAPPVAVLSLTWDTPFDLDLIVQNPLGAVVGGKNAATTEPDGTVSAADKSQGVLDQDSNRNCDDDGIQREDIVWQTAPTPGTYEVWVDPFAACGQATATFTVTVWLATPQADGTQKLVAQPPLANGEVTALQSNAGENHGLFVGEFVLQ